MKKKLYVIAIIITLVMSLLVVKVNADDSSFTASLKSNSTSVSKGKEFTVTLKISNLNVGSKGLSELEGTFKYDDKVFEKVSADNIEGINGWKAQYSEDTGSITLMNPSFCKEDTEVCKIALKTLSDTTSSKGNIEFTKIIGSNSESEITADDVSLNINIGSSTSSSGNSIKINSSSNTSNKANNSSDDDETTTISTNSSRNTSNKNNNANTESNTNTKTNTNKSTNNNSNSNSNVNKEANETDEDEMPNTGIDDTIVQATILVALVAFLGYIKLKSLDRK